MGSRSFCSYFSPKTHPLRSRQNSTTIAHKTIVAREVESSELGFHVHPAHPCSRLSTRSLQALALKVFTQTPPIDPEPLESHCLECLDEGRAYQACTASGQVRQTGIPVNKTQQQ